MDTQSNRLPKKWWPKKKAVNTCWYQRKSGQKLLIEELYYASLSQNETRIINVCESASASQLRGLGGVGKTATVEMYAHNYEDAYDYLLWFNVENSTLTECFQKLAFDLKVTNWSELITEEDYSSKCFEALAEFKCLWILDNVRNCQETESIYKIVNQSKNSHYWFVVSRNRFEFTGTNEHQTLSTFHVSIFTTEESLDFLSKNLLERIKFTDSDLRQLCQLLRNLPLALQMAVAILNNEKIDMQAYIEQLSYEESKKESELNDFETFICRVVKISLDLILKEDHGDCANNVLKLFAYISPDDVDVRFFESILNLHRDEKFKLAISSLTDYSMIMKTVNKSSDATNETKSSGVSMPRLVHQAIRHINKQEEEDTLRKIFSFRRFLDYKIFPFMNYANETLQNEHPKVWILLLKKTLKEKNFTKALQLAEDIHKKINTNTTLYNYIVCLEKQGQVSEATIKLEELYHDEEVSENRTSNFYFEEDLIEMGRKKDFVETGIIKLQLEVTKELVGGHLWVIYWRLGNRKRVTEMIESRNTFTTIYSKESLHIVMEILDQNPTNANYCIQGNNHVGIRFEFGGDTQKVDFFDSYIDSNIRFPSRLQDLSLRHAKFTNEYAQQIGNFDLSNAIPYNLKKLTLSSSCHLSLEILCSVDEFDLGSCSIILDSGCRISPITLNFFGVHFIRNGKELDQVTVNEFLDFKRINKLTLTCFLKDNMNIDLSEELINLDTLDLRSTIPLNWETSKWVVDKLLLLKVPFLKKTQMTIRHFEINWELIDVSALPETVETLTLLNRAKLMCSGPVTLPNLKYLTLHEIEGLCLSHFNSCKNLTNIKFREMKNVNADLLPESVTWVEFHSSDETIFTGAKKINSLTLEFSSKDAVVKALNHLHPQKYLKMNYCNVDLKVSLPKKLQELILTTVRFRSDSGEEIKNCDISEWIPQTLSKLTLDCFISTVCTLSLKRLCTIQELNLQRCNVILDWDGRLSPSSLRLDRVTFIRDGKQVSAAISDHFDLPC